MSRSNRKSSRKQHKLMEAEKLEARQLMAGDTFQVIFPPPVYVEDVLPITPNLTDLSLSQSETWSSQSPVELVEPNSDHPLPFAEPASPEDAFSAFNTMRANFPSDNEFSQWLDHNFQQVGNYQGVFEGDLITPHALELHHMVEDLLANWKHDYELQRLATEDAFHVEQPTLSVPTLPSPDIDENGVVDFGDFLLLSANFGNEVVPGTLGDIDGDGSVAFSDFLSLSSEFGASNKTYVHSENSTSYQLGVHLRTHASLSCHPAAVEAIYRRGTDEAPVVAVAKPPQVKLGDTDRDGKVDVVVLDANQDGKPEHVFKVAHGSDSFDTWMQDTNGDGKYDRFLTDKNGDGYADVVLEDKNHDGKFDHGLVDIDGDGQFEAEWTDGANGGPKDGDRQPQEIQRVKLPEIKIPKINVKDFDGDGKPDYVSVDRDRDGKPESVYSDTDGDGKFDTQLHDDDDDGKFDRGSIDHDGDGKADSTWVDGRNGQPKDGKVQPGEVEVTLAPPKNTPGGNKVTQDAEGSTNEPEDCNDITFTDRSMDELFGITGESSEIIGALALNLLLNNDRSAADCLKEAAKAMRTASEKLAKGDLDGALKDQQRAIDLLKEAEKKLESDATSDSDGQADSGGPSNGAESDDDEQPGSEPPNGETPTVEKPSNGKPTDEKPADNGNSSHTDGPADQTQPGSGETQDESKPLYSTRMLRRYGHLIIQYYIEVADTLDKPHVRKIASNLRDSIEKSDLTAQEKKTMFERLDKLDALLK